MDSHKIDITEIIFMRQAKQLTFIPRHLFTRKIGLNVILECMVIVQ